MIKSRHRYCALRLGAVRCKVAPALLTVALALGLLAAGCSRGGAPLASLKLSTTEIQLPYGALVVVAMRMECLRELPAGPMVLFTHLLDAEGKIVRTFDRPFSVARVQGCVVTTPLTLWQSALSAPLPAGRYRLRVGLSSARRGRIPLAVEGVVGHRRGYEVAQVVVPELSEPWPRLVLDGTWKAPASAEDRQLPGQRWLESDGDIVVKGIRHEQTLRLSVRLLEAEENGLKLVLQEGETQPAFTLEANCDAGRGRFVGAVDHDLRVRLTPSGETNECRLHLAPNFTLIDPRTLERTTLGLERATWLDLIFDGSASGAATAP